MKLGYLTMMICNLNAIVDSGRHLGVSMEEAHRWIRHGEVFSRLESQFKGAVDFSLFDATLRARISEELQSILGGYSGDERRKWGVENNGICLLIAWTNEIVQSHWGENAA